MRVVRANYKANNLAVLGLLLFTMTLIKVKFHKRKSVTRLRFSSKFRVIKLTLGDR